MEESDRATLADTVPRPRPAHAGGASGRTDLLSHLTSRPAHVGGGEKPALSVRVVELCGTVRPRMWLGVRAPAGAPASAGASPRRFWHEYTTDRRGHAVPLD